MAFDPNKFFDKNYATWAANAANGKTSPGKDPFVWKPNENAGTMADPTLATEVFQPKTENEGETRSSVTGMNTESTTNSWRDDSGFFSRFQESYRQAVDAGTARSFFSEGKNTGIAMWDDEANNIKFGDVFVDGVKQENLYYDTTPE